MTKVIDVNHLEKAYEQKNVLQDISFSIQQKEIFGLLGPSGAGKTTIIKILTAQLLFEKGDVKVFQRPVSEIKQYVNSKKMGILNDNNASYNRLSCLLYIL